MRTGPRRVLYIVFDGTLGGSLASCADFVRHTDPQLFEVTFCILGNPGATSDLIASMGVEVVSFGATSWRDPRAALAFWRFLQARTFDVVHNNARTYFGHAVLLLAARGTPLIYQEHGDLHTEGDAFACRVFYRVFRRIYTLFLTVGPDTLEAMVEERVPRRLIRDLGSPVDVSQFSAALDRREAKTRLGLRPDDLVVGTACRLVHQKDLGLFVDTAAIMAASDPRLQFVIAGEGGDEQELRARSAASGLEQRISFVGNRTDMPALWRAFDLFLLTSRQESFGRTILESLASGTPIVGVRPDMGGGRILDAAAGVRIITGRESGDLSTAALALCRDQPLRDQLGMDGRRWVLEQTEYGVEGWASRMRQAYVDVSAERVA